MKENEDLGTNLCAAAHLIHGSSEGRFKVSTWPHTKVFVFVVAR